MRGRRLPQIATRLCAKWAAAAEGDGIVNALDDFGKYGKATAHLVPREVLARFSQASKTGSVSATTVCCCARQ